MKYNLSISQTKSVEWGLNAQQALLFAFVYECPSWTNAVPTDNGVFFALSKAKIVEELPLLTSKPDTAYRLLKQLAEAGVIELSHTNTITLVRITPKGKEWNHAIDGSEKYPSGPDGVGKKSEVGRKNLRGGSEKSPTNTDTSNTDTSNTDKTDMSTVKDIFDHWRWAMNSPRSKMDENRRALIVKALGMYAVEDLKRAIDGCKVSPFHMGANDRKEKYNGLHLIFRNAEKIDGFMAKADTPPIAPKQTAISQDFSEKEYKGTANDAFADFLQDDPADE